MHLKKPNTLNLMIVGKGGQGILLASNLIIQLCTKKNLDVKKSQIQGIAQRGGSVISQIRIGKKVLSPLIPNRNCNFLLAMDPDEGERWKPQLHPKGTFISINPLEEKNIPLPKSKNIYILAKFFRQLKLKNHSSILPLQFTSQEILNELKILFPHNLYNINSRLFLQLYHKCN